MGNVKLKDIAEALDVSTVTVSNALAGRKGVSEEVRSQVVEKAKEYNIPIRVGVNSGSLEKHLVEKYHGVTAEGLVESALDKVHMIEEMGYDNLVVSIKSSDVMMSALQNQEPCWQGISNLPSDWD